jgi:hypothetical protein
MLATTSQKTTLSTLCSSQNAFALRSNKWTASPHPGLPVKVTALDCCSSDVSAGRRRLRYGVATTYEPPQSYSAKATAAARGHPERQTLRMKAMHKSNRRRRHIRTELPAKVTVRSPGASGAARDPRAVIPAGNRRLGRTETRVAALCASDHPPLHVASDVPAVLLMSGSV